nr:PDZ domain-containing protein [Bauldia sp.]
DLVTSVDGVDIDDPSAFNYRLATRGIGATVSVGITRDGKPYVAKLALEPAPETTPRAETTIAGQSPLAGVTVLNLSPAVAEELAFKGDVEGVIVGGVAAGTAAEMAGFARGDVVLEVNGVAIDTTDRLVEVCAERLRFWQVSILRNGRVISTRFRG